MPELTDTELMAIRTLIDESDEQPTKSVAALQALFDQTGGSVLGVVALVWLDRAGAYHKKVSVASGQNKIELNQQYEHAKELAESYLEMAGGPEAIGAGEIFEYTELAAVSEVTGTGDSHRYAWPDNTFEQEYD